VWSGFQIREGKQQMRQANVNGKCAIFQVSNNKGVSVFAFLTSAAGILTYRLIWSKKPVDFYILCVTNYVKIFGFLLQKVVLCIII
jgi:uncharacterized membrane protein